MMLLAVWMVCFSKLTLCFCTFNRLNGNSSASPDGLPAIFFKHTAYNVTYPLSVIFNMSMQTGDMLSIWRSAIFTPSSKRVRLLISRIIDQYPISRTCISCKLLESGVKDAFLKHFLAHKIITQHKHEFLSKTSTTTQLLECSLDWSIALASSCTVDIAHLDYAKTFDSVVHSKLLAKLAHFGVPNFVLNWIKSVPQ